LKIGDLLQMKANATLWLALDVIDNTDILVLNLNTGHKMWVMAGYLEVISESR